MPTKLNEDIAAVRQQIELATAKLRDLEERAKAPEPVKPWEPKGGEYFLNGLREVATVCVPASQFGAGVRHPIEERARTLAGLRWPSRAAAESALPYLAFYQRLCCLAQELNPSGRVGGRYYVFLNTTSATHRGAHPPPQHRHPASHHAYHLFP